MSTVGGLWASQPRVAPQGGTLSVQSLSRSDCKPKAIVNLSQQRGCALLLLPCDICTTPREPCQL